MTHKWNYSGDISLEYGGFFWREDDAEDYVRAVQVTPCSDAGGPDNLYCIEIGSVYLPLDADERKRALDTIGASAETATRAELVEAFRAYHGIERDTYGEHVVRIGKAQETRRGGWAPKPDKVLPANAGLQRYVEREFLAC